MELNSVTKFREYLRIRTDHPNPDYHKAAEFLKDYAKELNLKCQIAGKPAKPVVILTWEGLNPALPTILLNSHTDVVPAVLDKWSVDPFAAHKDEHGDIYARGTQDMKCVCIQFLEAVRQIQEKGVKLLRTVHLTFVPDEEIGGLDGMGYFISTPEFKALNVGLAIDEGLASPTSAFTVFNGERAAWWTKVKAIGPTGHGSRFIEGTAVEKLMKVVNNMLAFRQEQFDTLHKGQHECGKKLGDVTTLNLTVLKAGVSSDNGKTFSYNVIPTEAEAGFDIRIPPTVNLEEFMAQLKAWCSEEGVSFSFLNYTPENHLTPVTSDNVWWNTFKKATDELDIKIETEIFPAATDSRFLRNIGIPAFGFSPINNTPILLHDHNEFLNEKVFVRGIEIYSHIITALANVAPPS
eukprot:TRINITY_DN2551_c0_g1_i2.p1 TRINITY_DN2551_c0_g1~~TRINITY_DN2551_c0_g1_i2.p1  ORF type:complete len:426 (+),score=98.35 TRINITY_DN2551_c0_g1_i2:60-1280(+)